MLSSHRLTQSRLYLSDSKIEIARNPHSGTELIQPYLRTCLKDVPLDVDANKSMEFTVSFLGTGGGAPTRNRNGSCTALRLGGQTFLFDVCEGTQRQLGFTRIWPLSITKIFISHLHGDHLFGLVPLILEIQVAAKVQSNAAGRKKKFGMSEELPVLEIYGPPGLYNYINMTLALSCAKVNYLNVTVIELVGGREERGPNALQRRGRRNVFLSHYPEIETPKIRRQYLEAVSNISNFCLVLYYGYLTFLFSLFWEQNENKVWVIDNPEQVTADMLEIGGDGYHRLPNDPNLGSNRRLFINAAELDHLAGVQTFGYTVEEQTPPRNIDPEKASALGLKPGKKYSLLKAGLSVPTDDGTDIVYPDQVLMEYVRPRKVAILADHRLVPAPMAQLCMDSDFLVHEATLKKSDGLDVSLFMPEWTGVVCLPFQLSS